MRKRVLFYYYYFYGIGHTQTVLVQANAIKKVNPTFDVMVINGGKPIKEFDYSDDIEFVQLPSIVAKLHPSFKLKSGAISISYRNVIEMRKKILISILKYYRPHIIITEFFPFDRKFLSDEIISMLKYAQEKLKKCTIISSTREIIATPEDIWNKYTKRIASQRIKKYYDYVFVHGDPKVFKLDEELSLEVQKKFIYTGYLTCKEKSQLISKETIRKSYLMKDKFLVVVSVGGGKDGFCLLKNAILAERILNRKKILYKFLLFTGPNMVMINYNSLINLAKMSRDLSIQRFNTELVDLINASDISISMGGYSTCAEIMLTNTRSIIVPRVIYEREQLIRSCRLAELNITNVIHPRNSTPQLLASEITRIIGTSRPRHNIDLNGADFVANFVRNCKPLLF